MAECCLLGRMSHCIHADYDALKAKVDELWDRTEKLRPIDVDCKMCEKHLEHDCVNALRSQFQVCLNSAHQDIQKLRETIEQMRSAWKAMNERLSRVETQLRPSLKPDYVFHHHKDGVRTCASSDTKDPVTWDWNDVTCKKCWAKRK